MPDSDSSAPNLTPEELARLLPDSWIHHHEIAKPRQSRQYRNANSVVIHKTRLNMPLATWEELGKPAKITCYFSGTDTMIVPAAEISLKVGKTWASVLFEDKAEKFRPYVLPGVYGADKFRVEHLGDIRYLRIIGSCFMNVNRKWLQHWELT